ncbi:PAS domain-containing protein [Bradyrhizobium sp. dw_411]|uniref:PAS domain-containing protein n=1 Tax=Bradyrhizobium sp. dw_411 TaxID=2720082 RepID=UPI001BCA8473|nr:PAS domain-containing protein [Bradyrhizobium sp. dw_411]
MNNAEFQLRGVGDPRLAVYATSALPVWLWSIDGTRILWANPVGARLFGAANGAALTQKLFGPADQHRRQVAQLANRLPANGTIRLERLRGFGASLGALVTCGCARLDFADGSHGVLVAAAEPIGRAMPLAERLARLVDGIDTPIAAFLSDGMFIGASAAARSLLGFRNLNEAGLDDARSDALKQGRSETPVGIGHMVLQRVGAGADIGLVALIAPGAVQSAPVHKTAPPAPEVIATAPILPEPVPQPAAPAAEPTPDYEQPAMSGEAPAEFALIDEFAEPPEEPAVERTVAEHAISEPVISEQAAEPEQPVAVTHEPPTVPIEAAAETVATEMVASEFTLSETTTSPTEIQHEPSPYVEAVADEPASPAAEEPSTIETPITPPPVAAASEADESTAGPRRHPLRFMWQMDADGRFTLGSEEFTRLIGAHTAAGFGRPWSEIAEHFGLDPEGHIVKAIATRGTWSGITLDWPIDSGGRLPVELSGLPIYDYTGNLTGYRGFGICRDLDGLTRLDELRRNETFSGPATPPTISADPVEADAQDSLVEDSHTPQDTSTEGPPIHEAPPHEALVADAPTAEPPPVPDETASEAEAEPSAPIALETSENSPPTDLEPAVETPNEMLRNVVPFRPMSEPKSPVLTPVENNAFNELARQLSARLESENITFAPPVESSTTDVFIEPPAAAEIPGTTHETIHETASEQPSWLTRPEPPARGETRRDRALLDLIPVGILIYRLDRLLYANSAFLTRMGYASLHALEQAGGLDALYVEPGVSSTSSTSDTGTPVTISANHESPEHSSAPATDAHLFTISWDDDSALALIFANAGVPNTEIAAAMIPAVEAQEPSEPSAVGHANAEELGAILDTTAEGIVMFDAEGNINSCNRSAEALFGYDGLDLIQRNLVDLFAPESQPAVMDYLSSIRSNGVTSLLDAGREVLARVHGGGLIPVSMTMGRTRHEGPNFFAVFRDLSQTKKSESELQQARRTADRAANAKADMLARISHEVRTPLNAIIGFAEVMIGERFGALGNERYVEYMKDIRASGERVIAIINDLLDLSRIETGKLDLAFANQNLNDLVESCVAVMQPQANRERIIIRTSLAHMLPPVIADARALRQITLNLIGNSIHLANAGGQVIVSTALSDFGEVVLRVRDTGHGLNDNEVAAAMEPFRTQPPSDKASDGSGVNLSLTKALVEANRARFQIKTGPRSGTLIEVLFSHAVARV